MPGGKVVVHMAILSMIQNKNGLAVVMGHEIVPAVAKHGNERRSRAQLTQMGGIALAEALQRKPQQTPACQDLGRVGLVDFRRI